MCIDLSIVVPAYNEEKRIGSLLRDYTYVLSSGQIKWEIIIVVNNSSDKTEDIVKRYQVDYPGKIRLLVFQYPTGKGGALIEGLSIAEGKYLSYVDADDSLTARELLRLYNKVIEKKDSDILVMACRWMKDSKVIPPLALRRKIASRGYNFLVNVLFGLRVKDSQCGGKIFSKELFYKIKDQLFIADMSFDVNLLYSARKLGACLVEIPVMWYNKEGSKVDLWRTSLLMFLSLMRLRLYYSPFKFVLPFGERIFSGLRMRWTGMRSSRYGKV